jgi:hypothetical protein
MRNSQAYKQFYVKIKQCLSEAVHMYWENFFQKSVLEYVQSKYAFNPIYHTYKSIFFYKINFLCT